MINSTIHSSARINFSLNSTPEATQSKVIKQRNQLGNIASFLPQKELLKLEGLSLTQQAIIRKGATLQQNIVTENLEQITAFRNAVYNKSHKEPIIVSMANLHSVKSELRKPSCYIKSLDLSSIHDFNQLLSIGALLREQPSTTCLSLRHLTLNSAQINQLLPYFIHIGELDLTGTYIGDLGAAAIANSEHIKNLTKLILKWNNLGDQGIASLAKSVNLSNLTVLSLQGNTIGTEGAQELATTDTLKNLIDLDLSWNDLRDQGIVALSSTNKLSRLSKLNLKNNNIREAGAQALANSENFKGLIDLNLSENIIATRGAQALSASYKLSNLLKLNLDGNYIMAEGVESLANSTKLTGLTFLDLSRNGLGTDGARALANSSSLKNLNYLNLSFNKLGVDGAHTITITTTLTNLITLDLSGNKIGDLGTAVALTNAKNLKTLTKLDLRLNQITYQNRLLFLKNHHPNNLSILI